MKITGIKILNVLGSRRIDFEPTAPITLFFGPNGTGKSSIHEAVRMALLGEVLRVEHKQDYPLMVTDGAKKGSIVITTDGKFEHTVDLPKGDIKTAEYGYPREVMASVMNAQRFAGLTSEQRRKFLFDLTNCHATPDKVRTLLADRHCDPVMVEATIPMLRAGFPSACESAKKKATEAKGSWRATTGETWGSIKGADWKATAPDVDQEAITQANAAVEAIDAKVADTRREIAIIEGRVAEQKKNAVKLEQAKTTAATLPRAKDKLSVDEKSLADAEISLKSAQERAGTAPRVGLVHDMAKALTNMVDEPQPHGVDRATYQAAIAVLDQYVGQFGEIGAQSDAEALAQVPTLSSSVSMLKRAIENDKRDIASAEAAAQLVETLGGSTEVDGNADIAKLQSTLKEVLAQRNEAAKVQDKLNLEAVAAASAEEKTKKSESYHKEVMEWNKIGEALGPDGIPGELLATALKPINEHLRESARLTGWMQVTITPDMAIKADSRLYQLLSESEKWRTDAMIAESIAQISDIRVLMLDRMDVLEPARRPELLLWLDEVVQAGGLESILLFATLKAPPTGLPPSIETIWIEQGEIKETIEA
jgi:RNase P/RNase MRP subunit p29